MDIGDIVILGGKRFLIRGFDPAGVVPRFVYLEETKTGKMIPIGFEELSRAKRGGGVLRLVEDEAREPPC